jgi:hypothetical protein
LARFVTQSAISTYDLDVKRADELSFELTRAVLTQISPDEVPMVDALGLEFVEAASAPHGGDGALGFDVESLSYAVAASSCAVLVKDYLIELAKAAATELGKSLASEQGPSLVKALRRKRGAEKDKQPTSSVHLDPAEINEVRKRAFAHAQRIGMDEAKATLLADALAGSLAVTG